MKYKSDFLNFIQDRGILYQCTNIQGLDQFLFQNNYIVAYIGFDCTARSLHIGSLIQIMMLRNLQKFGYKAIILLGGATTKIGDPSGKDKARSILTVEEINSNISNIRKILEKFISVDDVIIVNNLDWLSELKYIDFLCDVGTHFSINRMLTFDSVQNRLSREQNLSFLEFNYMILQAYDFTVLNKQYECRLQIGGSDQWGNIVNGIELAKKLNLPELFGLTTLLLLNSQGNKMGKTESGAIWLDSDMLKPYDYWQYFRNIDDKDVSRFLRLFTDLPIKEIEKLELLQGQEINETKKILATEVTKICHGDIEAENAYLVATSAFEKKDFSLLNDYILQNNQITNGITLVDLLCMTKLESSKSSAKRLIQAGGCKINNHIIHDINYVVDLKTFANNLFFKLSVGKKRYVKVVIPVIDRI
ncbi:MAG: tyrosine--tRNA ligase [Wolbachia endosymbiont of Fragariocoptes setiger]|nr:tyrosine--tRNA ligase [Wolbachia endosymbiont of Fragariocoptes setiger]